MPVTARGESRQGVARALQYVESHYAETLPLRVVASVAGLSPSHFCRMFRAATGKTFREYLRDIRIARAQDLLAGSYRTLTEIAIETGFYDLPHFDKVFVKEVGVSPRAFRSMTGPESR